MPIIVYTYSIKNFEFTVLEFSKKTGDFATLSTVDLQIIALTYQLEKENVGTDHLHTEPSRNVCFCHFFFSLIKNMKVLDLITAVG